MRSFALILIVLPLLSTAACGDRTALPMSDIFGQQYQLTGFSTDSPDELAPDKFVRLASDDDSFYHSRNQYLWVRLSSRRPKDPRHYILPLSGISTYEYRLYEQNHPQDELTKSEPMQYHLLRTGGASYPHSVREFDSVRLAVTLVGNRNYLLRLESRTFHVFPRQLYKVPGFFAFEIGDYLAIGMFLGAALIMMIYNLFLGLGIKDRVYLYYAMYTLAMVLFVLHEGSYLYQFISPPLAVRGFSYQLLYPFLAISSLLFVHNFLQIKQLSPRLHRLFQLQIGVSVVLIMALPPLPYGIWKYLLLNLNFLMVIGLILTAAGLGLRRGQRSSRYFFMAAACVVVAAIPRFVILSGQPHMDFVINHGLKIGVVLELAILAFGLADRYNQLRDRMQNERLRHYSEKELFTQELHDNIGSQVSSALINIDQGGDRQTLQSTLEEVIQNTKDFAAVIAMDSRPDRDFSTDVAAYIHNLQGVERYSVDWHFDDRLNALELGKRLHMTRIFTEWMTNLLRHAKSDTFRIRFLQTRGRTGDYAVVIVDSNGSFFRFGNRTIVSTPGFGLPNILKRVRRLKARLRTAKTARPETPNRFLLAVPLVPIAPTSK